jgi:hypothetical protein
MSLEVSMGALAVSPAAARELTTLEKEMERTKALAKRFRTEMEERSDQLMFSGEFVLAAMATGWAQGAYGEHTTFGFRTDMLVGGALVLWGLWTDSDWGDHLVNLGMGAVAVSAASWAARKGVAHHQAAGSTTPSGSTAPTSAGNAGSRGMRLTDDMLSRMGSTIG